MCLSVVAVLATPSYGLFMVPLAVLGLVLAMRAGAGGGGLWGIPAGIGLGLVVVGIATGLDSSCGDGVREGEVIVCGEEDSPVPWLAAGGALFAASAVFCWQRVRSRRRR